MAEDGNGGGRSAVQSVDRAVAILRCFDARRPTLGISDIARATGLSTTTTHRLLVAMQSNRLVRQTSDRRYGLGPLLVQLARSGALPMNKASALLQVHPTSVTNAVDRLQDAGLVVRSPHPTDGRTTLIELTAEGRTLAKSATAALNTEVFGQSGFASQDVDQLIRILGNFRRNAGDFAD